eukprot:Clim_evm53s108 gene=Clim_evmTU53s108
MRSFFITALVIGLLALIAGNVVHRFGTGPLRPVDVTKAPGKLVKLSHGTVHYRLDEPTTPKKDSELVVFVHGVSSPLFVFDQVAKRLNQAGYRTLRFDLYGRGFSDSADTEHGNELFVGQLAEILFALDIKEKIHLVGLSLGGAISIQFADAYPQRLRSVTLLMPAGFAIGNPGLLKVGRQMPLLIDAVISAVGIEIVANVQKEVRRDEMRPEIEVYYNTVKDQIHNHPGFLRSFLSTIQHFDFEVHDMAKNVDAHHKDFSLRAIWAEKDTVIPAKATALFRELCPHADDRVVPNAGHFAVLEAYEELSGFLLEHIKEN